MMSQENVETGNLICVIGNASKHVWSLRGFDLFLYEHAVAAIRVTAQETFTGHHAGVSEGLSSSGATQRRLSGKEARQPIGELLDRHPKNRLVPKASIRGIEGGRGWKFSTLRLTLDDGEKLGWMWLNSTGPPSEELQAAIHRLGSQAAIG